MSLKRETSDALENFATIVTGAAIQAVCNSDTAPADKIRITGTLNQACNRLRNALGLEIMEG